MAKKVRTPEEVRSAMEKKVAKRTLFFGTFRKALALFLGITFAFAMVQIAFTKNAGGAVTSSGATGSTPAPGQNEEQTVDFGDGEDDSTVKEGETFKDENGKDSVALSKAEAVKLLNDATAQAVKAGYDWSRKCYYTDDGALNVKLKTGMDATSFLNNAISSFSDSDLNKVVGNFLDITGKDDPKAAKKAKGSNAAPEGMKDKFLLKATTLTEGDIAKYQPATKDNIYKFQINTCANPQKDGGNALHHFTDDFVTGDQVKNDVKEATKGAIKIESVDVQYSEIVVVAEIKDGKLISLSLSYLMDVKSLNLKALGMSIIGTGKGRVEETYKNFVY